MANARAQVRAKAAGGAAAQPGAEGSGGGFWKWAALGGLGLLVAGGLVAAAVAPKAEPYNPQQWAAPTATPRDYRDLVTMATIDRYVTEVIRGGPGFKQDHELVYGSVDSVLGEGFVVIERNPAKTDKQKALNVLAYFQDMIPVMEQIEGVPHFRSNSESPNRVTLYYIDSEGQVNTAGRVTTDSNQSLWSLTDELVKMSDFTMPFNELLEEGVGRYITYHVLEEMAKLNPESFQRLNTNTNITTDEVEQRYAVLKGLISITSVGFDAQRGYRTVFQNGSAVRPPPEDAVPLESILLKDATWEKNGISFEFAGMYMSLFMIELEHDIGWDAVRSGIREVLINGMWSVRSNDEFYQKLRAGVSAALPEAERDAKLRPFDDKFRIRFFGDDEFRRIRPSFYTSASASSQANATATVTALPNQYSRLLLPSEQSVLEAKLGR